MANTDVSIATYGIVVGKYIAYTADGTGNVSTPGTNIIRISDGIPPIALLANNVRVTNASGQFVNLRSNETPSRLFLILDGSVVSTYTDFQTLVLNEKGAMALSMVDDSIAVPTNNLIPGTYYAYAVDNDDNISDRSLNSVIVSEYTGVQRILDSKLTIYTSGSDIILDISVPIQSGASVEVFDLLGHKVGVYSLHQGVNTICTSINGICILKLCIEKQVVVTKLLVL